MSDAVSTTGSSSIPGEPILRDVKMHLASPVEPVVGRIRSSERCTVGGARSKSAGFVRHIEIDVSGTPLAGSFVPGQSFGVLAEGADAKGQPHKVRLYSLSSPTRGEDGSGNVVATTVKRTIDEHHETGKLFLGVCSNYLCDLRPGDPVRLSGPSGKRFVLPAEPSKHDYVFFATGTGIAPFRGMIFDLLDARAASSITLVMGSPYQGDLLYHETFTDLARTHANFTYLPTLSRQPQEGGEKPMYVQQRLTSHADLFRPALASERTLIYVCGIAGMELGIFQQLARTLAPDALRQYLALEGAARENVDAWERKMIPREIKPTRRVFLEVY
jgi:ferredoxin--NADP+ reductase